MNAIQSFLGKYHAVPAGESGPRWDAASLDRLLGWFTADVKALRAGEVALRIQVGEVAGELWRRVRAGVASQPVAADEVGRIVAALAQASDVLEVSVK